jgi:hypothetical protein
MERRKQLVLAGVAALTLIVVVVLVLQASRPKNPSAEIGRAPVISVPTSSADVSASPDSATSSASATATGSTGDASADDLGAAPAPEAHEILEDPKNVGKTFTITGADGKVVAIPDDGTEAE